MAILAFRRAVGVRDTWSINRQQLHCHWLAIRTNGSSGLPDHYPRHKKKWQKKNAREKEKDVGTNLRNPEINEDIISMVRWRWRCVCIYIKWRHFGNPMLSLRKILPKGRLSHWINSRSPGAICVYLDYTVDFAGNFAVLQGCICGLFCTLLD